MIPFFSFIKVTALAMAGVLAVHVFGGLNRTAEENKNKGRTFKC